ncbi:hypothetical protein ACTFIY_006523 [Dictyostelium cf. discoideum]
MLIHGLPYTSRTLIFQLFGFLSKFSVHQDPNKMTPKNLATVFAPNEDNFQLMNNQDSIGVIETLIEEYQYISNIQKNTLNSQEIKVKSVLPFDETTNSITQQSLVEDYLIARANTPQKSSRIYHLIKVIL